MSPAIERGVLSFYNVQHQVLHKTDYKELGKIDKDVYRIAGEKIGVEPELLDKPSLGLD